MLEEVKELLNQGKTFKEIKKILGLSHRQLAFYKGRLPLGRQKQIKFNLRGNENHDG